MLSTNNDYKKSFYKLNAINERCLSGPLSIRSGLGGGSSNGSPAEKRSDIKLPCLK